MPYRRRSEGPSHPTIAAVLLPRERSGVEAAGNGCFRVVHRDSIPDAIRVVRERRVEAVLVSVHQCREQHVQAVGHLVRDFPGVPTVALLSGHDAGAAETVLHLGATGVQQVVDVTTPHGWRQLRGLVGPPAPRAGAGIRGYILRSLAGASPDTRSFFDTLVRMAPSTPTVRAVAVTLCVRPSTLMSRFSRSGLPSPKSYLAGIRLLHASFLFQSRGLTVADVAYQLEYSSPQSFGRHLRAMVGITATEFRRRFPFPVARDRFVDLMIRPYAAIWPDFHPLAT